MSAIPSLSNALPAVNAEAAGDGRQMAALQAGDDAVFESLMVQLQRPLFTFAWRYLHNAADAEELVIETFVRLHHARARLRPDTHLSAWLFTTLANLCHNRHRWRKRHPEVSLDAPTPSGAISERPSTALPPDAALSNDEAAAVLRVAVEGLPHDQRTVILLHHYESLSYRQIAEIVGCSERGVETRLYRARQQLKVALADYLADRA